MLDRNPNFARVAGMIASTHASDWTTIAERASVSVRTAKSVLPWLTERLHERGELPANRNAKAPTLFRWCGSHDSYIRSWCRRHLPRHAIAWSAD